MKLQQRNQPVSGNRQPTTPTGAKRAARSTGNIEQPARAGRSAFRAVLPGGKLLGRAAAIGTVFIWGFTFVPTKMALLEMGPFTLAALRFLLALVMMAILTRAERTSFSRAASGVSWARLALLGLTGVALFFGLQNLSLTRTSATEAGLISGAVPALTAGASALLLRERVAGLRVVGIAASVGGVAVVVLTAGAAGQGGSLEGDLLMLGATLAWVSYTLLNKDVGGKMPESVMLTYTMAIGTLLMLPPAVAEVASSGIGPLSPATWLSVLFLGLGGSGAAFWCWNTTLRRLDASEATTYINLVPLVNLGAAALILGESPTPLQLLGGALVILGVYLAGR